MSCHLSCAIFEQLSAALHWIMQNKYNVTHISHILDDFIFCGPPESDAALNALHRFQSITDYLNIPIKQSKTVFPTTCAILYEIEVDTTTIVLKLPQDRLITALDKVNDMCKRKRVQLRNLQSLLGLLSFCCKAIVPGRAFLSRLFDLTLEPHNPPLHQTQSTITSRPQSLKILLQSMEGLILPSPNTTSAPFGIKVKNKSPDKCG